MKKTWVFLVLLILPLLVKSVTLDDLQEQIIRMEMQRQIDYANLKAEIELQNNKTQIIVDKGNAYINKEMQSDFSQHDIYMRNLVIEETSPFKYILSTLLTCLALVSSVMLLIVTRY